MTLEAGRELDAEVATKVMGWSVELIVGPRDAFEEWRDPQGWRYGPDPKPYSTDIAAAWQVLEHVSASGWLWQIDMATEGGWKVLIDHPDGRIRSARADAAALAICQAALVAVSRSSAESAR